MNAVTSFQKPVSPVADTTKLTIKATLQAKILFGSSPFLLLRASALGRLGPDKTLLFELLDRLLDHRNRHQREFAIKIASAGCCTSSRCRSSDMISAGRGRTRGEINQGQAPNLMILMAPGQQCLSFDTRNLIFPPNGSQTQREISR